MPPKASDPQENYSTMVIFAYAPTGLGHLRVTDALHDGMPFKTKTVVLGAQDMRITYIHRIMSTSQVGRFIFEWFQNGFGEDLFTGLYRNALRSNTKTVYEQVLTLIDQQYTPLKKVVCVCTHFSLAHQLAEIKPKIEAERKVEFNVVVQVTDDSPQGIWYIQGADLITVPSHETKKSLLSYGKDAGLKRAQFEVLPYPLSPLLTAPLSMGQFQQRLAQYNPNSMAKIHVSVPVSGAAVGLKYTENIISTLRRKSDRFIFHIVSKEALYTEDFLAKMKRRDYVKVYSSSSDREVVNAYEHMYKENIIGFEITKPSEQAFKTLISPRQVGGAIMLFTEPVGRQEYDNLIFMRKNELVPLAKEDKEMQYDCFRGLRLLDSYQESADHIMSLFEMNVFHAMSYCQKPSPQNEEQKDEIGSDGVKRFWKTIKRYL